jgi:dCMP deaminase
MTRASWDETWAGVARVVAKRSACERAQVGAVLVKDNYIIATGYNGPASGHPADTSKGCRAWCHRASWQDVESSTGYGLSCPSIHAEANALLHRRWGVLDMTLYVTHAPCADCAKLISNSGVSRVVMLRSPEPHRPNPIPYLTDCGIEALVYDETT